LGVLVTVVTIWLPALTGEFVWDDHKIMESPPMKRVETAARLFVDADAWSEASVRPLVPTYRPVALASMAVENYFFAETPWAFHLTNIVLHGLCAALFFLLLCRVQVTPAISALAAMLWAVHPSTAEAVAWINGRSEVWALFFGLCALSLAAKTSFGRRDTIVTAVALTLAMLGKETGAIFVPLTVALRIVQARQSGEQPAGRALWRNHWPIALSGLMACIAYAALRYIATEQTSAVGASGALQSMLNLPAIWSRAAQAVLVPVDLSVQSLHQWLLQLTPPDRILSGAAALAMVGLFAYLWHRGHRLTVVGFLWWIASLTPIAVVIVLDWPGLNRWLYIGLPGLLMGLAVLLPRTLDPRHVKRLLVAGGVVGVLSTVQTQRAISVWHDDETLWSRMIVEQPDAIAGYMWLGRHFLKVGKPEQALAVLHEATPRGSRNIDTHLLVSEALTQLGQCEQAQRHLSAWVPFRALQSSLIRDIALCYEAEGRLDAALPLFRLCAQRQTVCREHLEAAPRPIVRPPG